MEILRKDSSTLRDRAFLHGSAHFSEKTRRDLRKNFLHLWTMKAKLNVGSHQFTRQRSALFECF